MKKLIGICVFLISNIANASLVGHWTFEQGNETNDLTGNFSDLTLFGNATIANGQLDVNGSSTTSTGYANITGSGGYTGATIIDKTLVSWVTMESLSNIANAGSVLTIDRVTSDHFDGIVFAENISSTSANEITNNTWISGSSHHSRTNAFSSPLANQSVLNELIKLIFTYDDTDNIAGGEMTISGYINGVSLGSYTTNSGSSWDSGDAEIFFGTRHKNNSNNGGINALISEAQIYNHVLTQAEIGSLELTTVPEPTSLALLGLGLAVFGFSRKKKKA